MRFSVPEGTVKVSVMGTEYYVEHGHIDAPAHCKDALHHHSCFPAAEGPIVVIREKQLDEVEKELLTAQRKLDEAIEGKRDTDERVAALKATKAKKAAIAADVEILKSGADELPPLPRADAGRRGPGR